MQQKENRSHLVLFDVGGVELALDYNPFYRKAAKISKLSLEEFRDRFVLSGIEYDSLIGKINASQFLDGLRSITATNLSDNKLKALYATCWPRQIDGVIRLKRKAYEAGYAVGIFSNMTEIALEILSSKYPELFEVFNSSFPRVYSYEIGYVKPEEQAYRKVQGFGYEKVTFIDDKESYLRTGIEKFGWNGILFTPCIDQAEPIRAKHSDITIPSKNFKIADSESELEQALISFGVAIYIFKF